jgi:tetratricopeptide (TPR) repeat protein
MGCGNTKRWATVRRFRSAARASRRWWPRPGSATARASPATRRCTTPPRAATCARTSARSRSGGFDPRCDAIVRVEALKLREKLHDSYRTEGATDLVVISIPKGAYRAVFQVNEAPPGCILDDPDNLCCQADSLLLQGTTDAIARTRRHLHAAIERWPTHPGLHVTLAAATLAALESELISPDEGVPLLRRSAREALRLDAGRTDARFYERIAEIRRPDKTAALSGAHDALQFAPASPSAQFWMGSTLAADCRMGDALVYLHRAVSLRRDALFFQTWRAVALFCAGQREASLRHLHGILAFEPHDYLANYWLGLLCAHSARYDEAHDAAARAYDVSGGAQPLAALGFVEGRAGHIEAAESILQTLTEMANTRYVAHSGLGSIHIALGNLDLAATELRLAQAEGDWELGWARPDPRWEPVRGRLAGF